MSRLWASRSIGLALALAGAGAASCARPFDPQSLVSTLRVIAVQADHPTPAPDTDVTFQMLAYDGSPHAIGADGKPRLVEIVWIGGCEDPAGDLYYKCYDTMGPALDALRSGAPSPLVGRGSTYTWHLPADLVSRRSGSGKSKFPYGLAYVFYAVCAGKVVATGATDLTTPRLGCVDDSGAQVSSDGFVYGYMPLYSYPGIDNHNPIVTDGLFDGAPPSTQSCKTDADCAASDACGSTGVCLPVIAPCPTSGTCPSHSVQPTVDPSSAEPDPMASALAGAPRTEQIVVEYLTSAGSTSAGDTNIVVDPVAGPRTGYGGSWSPPTSAVGETRIWALVRDNREGVAWWTVDVVVR